MPAASAINAIFREHVVERVLLRRAQQIVEQRAPDQQQTVRELHDAARLRLRAAAELSDPASVPAAGVLFREAGLLLIQALRVAREPGASRLSGPESVAWLEERIASGELPAAPEELVVLRQQLAASEPLLLDRMSTEDQLAAFAALERSVSWLRKLIEPRTSKQIKRTRAVRLASLVTLGLAALIGLVALLTRDTNLAEGKQATASSYHPAAPTAAGLTNGDVESNYGVHTQEQAEPWVRVDLSAPTAIKSIKIYNRADGWQTEVLPLVLELSLDGVNFQEVARRSKLFAHDKPWVWKGDGRPARYVRLRMPRHGYIALTELEVFGSGAKK